MPMSRGGILGSVIVGTVSLVFCSLVSGCWPCAQVHCQETASNTLSEIRAPLESGPALVVAVTLGGISRLAARWRMQQLRQRGVRRGSRVLLEDGKNALLAVTAITSPLRLDADPDCEACVTLRGSMPLKIELGTDDGPHSSLRAHPSSLSSHWSVPARLKASWTGSMVEVRALIEAGTRPHVELHWRGDARLDDPLNLAALGLAEQAVTAEVLRAASELVVLRLDLWPNAEGTLDRESIEVVVQAPLVRIVVHARLGEGLDPELVRPGLGQDVSLAVGSSLLADAGFRAPAKTGMATAHLLDLRAARRALEYRVRLSERHSFFEVRGIAVPGRRGALPTFDLLGPPTLVEAGGSAGHKPPNAEQRAKAVGIAMRPLRGLLSHLKLSGPGGVPAGLMIARYEHGALLLESGFTDPRPRPSGPPPADRTTPNEPLRRPVPRLRAGDPSAPAPKVPAPPWAHPPQQSELPASR